ITIADTPAAAKAAVLNELLQVDRSAMGLRISWPSLGEGWVLQERAGLGGGAGWLESAEAIGYQGGRSYIEISADQPARLFRLYKP
ncbi:MAG: hypothetical protein ACKOET_07415, partial [Verrucomicrobiota bacterium]